jgi:hypothetical protein
MMLYMAVNNVENAQVTLDRAHLQVEKATNAVTSAQNAYNEACAKYGPNSKEAQDALAKLNTAQDALTVAQERASEAQRNYNNTLIFSALSVIPSLITAFTSIITIVPALTGGIDAVSGALDFLSANPIMLVIAGIAALVLGLIYAYQHCGPFRDVINDIAGVLSGAFSWALQHIQLILIVLLGPIGAVIDIILNWKTVSADLRDVLNFLWNDILVPIAKFLEEVFLKAIDDVTGAIKPFQSAISAVSSVAGDVSKGISDIGGALSHLCFAHAGPQAEEFNKTIKDSITLTDALTGKVGNLSSSLMGVGGAVGVGGVTGSISGIAAAAAPKGTTITINGPLLQMQGSADKATAQAAAKLLEDRLKNVTVEPSSHAAFSSHKRILLGWNK